jgi:hypothetical protein
MSVLQQYIASLFHTSKYLIIAVKLYKIKVGPSDFIVMVLIVLISEHLLLSRQIKITESVFSEMKLLCLPQILE